MRSDLWVACGIDTLENCELRSAPDDYLDGGECDAGVTLHVSFTCIFTVIVLFIFYIVLIHYVYVHVANSCIHEQVVVISMKV